MRGNFAHSRIHINGEDEKKKKYRKRMERNVCLCTFFFRGKICI